MMELNIQMKKSNVIREFIIAHEKKLIQIAHFTEEKEISSNAFVFYCFHTIKNAIENLKILFLLNEYECQFHINISFD